MKKFIAFFVLLFCISSCEIDTGYECYTFEVTTQTIYTPYRPGYYDVYRYERCGITNYTAYNEARSNEYRYSYYQGGYYVEEVRRCTYWRSY